MAEKPYGLKESTEMRQWAFYYKQGPAPRNGVVEASTAARGLLVATRWCMKNGYRPPAMVQPVVVADESILSEPIGPEETPLPDPVSATTRA